MKQIKTIKNRLDNTKMFDEEVNAAIAEGWELTRRDVIRPNAHPGGETSYTMLYAELEKEIITETERRSCYHCKWKFKTCNSEPCRNCKNGDRWEP
jgi:hypothetical protein